MRLDEMTCAKASEPLDDAMKSWEMDALLLLATAWEFCEPAYGNG